MDTDFMSAEEWVQLLEEWGILPAIPLLNVVDVEPTVPRKASAVENTTTPCCRKVDSNEPL